MSTEDFHLLRTLAGGLVRLSEVAAPGAFRLPYPADAQRALDRMNVACLLRGEPPPRSLPDLITWCAERPVAEWPLDLPAGEAGPGDRLVDPRTRTPTQLCYEWAVATRDTGTELYERHLMLGALDRCRGADAPESYTAFRRLLIERPVLTRGELALLHGNPDFSPVIDLVAEAYRSAPGGLARDGAFVSCSRCRCLLTPVGTDGWWCEQDRCRAEGPAAPGGAHRAESQVMYLARPLRMFVTGPGRAEIELEQALSALGLRVEMWPGYDAYDLRIHLPGGTVWAVDVKDRASPALLGRDARSLPAKPPYDAGFLVVPRYRFQDRPDYQVVFSHHRPPGAALTLCSDQELVTRARSAKRSARQTAGSNGGGSHA
jgi:pPIWI_RE three-gene island domain Y/REase associating with pPIWI_RE